MFKLQNILSPVRKSKYLFLSSGSHPLLSKSSQQISPNLCKQAIYSDHPGPPRTPLGHFRSSYQSIGRPPTVLIGLPPIVLTTSQSTWVRSSSKQITTRKTKSIFSLSSLSHPLEFGMPNSEHPSLDPNGYK